ncbi:hypothetical protein Tco_0849340, partial [Tanacetum coccineum]
EVASSRVDREVCLFRWRSVFVYDLNFNPREEKRVRRAYVGMVRDKMYTRYGGIYKRLSEKTRELDMKSEEVMLPRHNYDVVTKLNYVVVQNEDSKQAWKNNSTISIPHNLNDIRLELERESEVEAIQADCDVKATNIILQGLPPEVYALVSNHKVAKELWERIQLLMQGTSLTKQERECKLYDEFDKFAYKKGETLP